jgi:hypothetical protein
MNGLCMICAMKLPGLPLEQDNACPGAELCGWWAIGRECVRTGSEVNHEKDVILCNRASIHWTPTRANFPFGKFTHPAL